VGAPTSCGLLRPVKIWHASAFPKTIMEDRTGARED
jgi:hypothetical protein